MASWAGDRPVAVIAAGEQWDDGTLRFAIEDWLGAGAIISRLRGSRSADAEAAAAAFERLRGSLHDALADSRSGRELIPNSIIERAPSAELRADQLDEDSLPPYPKLDQVLEAYVELDRSREELSEDGFDPDVVERALAMIDRAEYKRRQAPPGVKLRPKAFGRDRRTPITNLWQG